MDSTTVERDVYAALDQIKKGKRAAREGDKRTAWFHMDNAEVRLAGLGIYAWGCTECRRPKRGESTG
jgi:hypothetical protein